MHGIEDTYYVVLENTFWTLGKGNCWCYDIFISKLARIPYFDRVRLYSIVSSAWTSTHWNFPSFIVSLCDFSYLIFNEDEDVPNWIMHDTCVLSQNVTK